MHLDTCTDVDDDSGRVGQVETPPFLHKLYLQFFSSLLYIPLRVGTMERDAAIVWMDGFLLRIVLLYDQSPFVPKVYLILIQSHFESSDQDGVVIGKWIDDLPQRSTLAALSPRIHSRSSRYVNIASATQDWRPSWYCFSLPVSGAACAAGVDRGSRAASAAAHGTSNVFINHFDGLQSHKATPSAWLSTCREVGRKWVHSRRSRSQSRVILFAVKCC